VIYVSGSDEKLLTALHRAFNGMEEICDEQQLG
jgi:hypothetical protein